MASVPPLRMTTAEMQQQLMALSANAQLGANAMGTLNNSINQSLNSYNASLANALMGGQVSVQNAQAGYYNNQAASAGVFAGNPFGTLAAVPIPDLTEEEIESKWMQSYIREDMHHDYFRLRAYITTRGVDVSASVSMPASLVKKLAKEFVKLETCDNILSEVTMGLMEGE